MEEGKATTLTPAPHMQSNLNNITFRSPFKIKQNLTINVNLFKLT